jgi:hypothetical protein
MRYAARVNKWLNVFQILVVTILTSKHGCAQVVNAKTTNRDRTPEMAHSPIAYFSFDGGVSNSTSIVVNSKVNRDARFEADV